MPADNVPSGGDDGSGGLFSSDDDENSLFFVPTKFQPDILKPNTGADMTFSLPAETDSSSVYHHYGQISALGPSRRHATSGKVIYVAV